MNSSGFWPSLRPNVSGFMHGWFAQTNQRSLARLLDGISVSCIVELGSWYGKSATFFMDHIPPNAVLICVDIWDAAQIVEAWTTQAPEVEMPCNIASILTRYPIYDTFLHNLWMHKDRLIPLRMRSVDGLKKIHVMGLVPDLVYIDANHTFDDVRCEVDTICSLFPKAIICGDDYRWKGVGEAVRFCADKHSKLIKRDGGFWQYSNL